MTVTTIPVVVSPEVKEVLNKKAESLGISTSEMFRQAVAAQHGVEFPKSASGGRGRAKKYATEEERKEAAKVRGKDQRALVKELLAKHKAEEAAANGTAVEGADDTDEDGDDDDDEPAPQQPTATTTAPVTGRQQRRQRGGRGR